MRKRKDMCSITCGLLAVCLALGMASLAQAAPQYVSVGELREEVVGGWHQAYEAHGRTITISLDDIAVPEVDAFPILKLRARVTDIARQPEGYQASLEKIDPATGQDSLFVLKGDTSLSSFLNGNVMQTRDLVNYTELSVDWSVYAEGNTISLGKAFDFMKREIAGFCGQELADSLTPVRIQVSGRVYQYNRNTGEYGQAIDHPDNIGGYSMQLTQSFFGIPVIGTGGGAFSTYLKNDRYGLANDVAAYYITPEALNFRANLLEVAEVVYPDVPLCSFASLQAEVEQLILEGRLRALADGAKGGEIGLQLGYVLFNDPNDATISWAVPAWMANGVVFDDAEKEAELIDDDPVYGKTYLGGDFGTYFFQGQHAAFIDSLDQSPTRRNVPKILTWDEVK